MRNLLASVVNVGSPLGTMHIVAPGSVVIVVRLTLTMGRGLAIAFLNRVLTVGSLCQGIENSVHRTARQLINPRG